MNHSWKYFALAILFLYTSVIQCVAVENKDPVLRIIPWVIDVFDHDPGAFTQGLEFRNGFIYESTGLYDQSSLRVLDTNGSIIKKIAVPGVFSEGCTVMGKYLYQLTWRETQCIVYSFPELIYKKALTYKGEGWGLANNTKSILMSNGSDTIFCRDSSFAILKKIPVTLDGKPLKNLNELEYARNMLFANVWFDDNIYEINLPDGKVKRIIDCNNIVKQEKVESDQSVLNGISYRADTDCFYITGKNWKHIYCVKIPR